MEMKTFFESIYQDLIVSLGDPFINATTTEKRAIMLEVCDELLEAWFDGDY